MRMFVLVAAMAAVVPTAVWAQTEDPDPPPSISLMRSNAGLMPTFNALLFAWVTTSRWCKSAGWTKVVQRTSCSPNINSPNRSRCRALSDPAHSVHVERGAGHSRPTRSGTARTRARHHQRRPISGQLLDALRKEALCRQKWLRRCAVGQIPGEKVVSDTTEKATAETRFGSHTVIAPTSPRSLRTPQDAIRLLVPITVLDKNGKPL